MSSTLDRETGEVIVTTPMPWCDVGHRLAVVGSPAALSQWSLDDRLNLLLLQRFTDEPANAETPASPAASPVARVD